MAKVSGPLFSLQAGGQLAKTLVYSRWKGISDVRSYVIPANPRSAGQTTQRGYFGDAVDEWHTLGLTADDVEAWNRGANNAPRPQSGFNYFVGTLIDLLVGGLSLAATAMGFNGGIADSGAGQVDFTVEEDGSAIGVDFKWGYTPTSLIETAAGVETLNVWNALNVAAATGAIVYMRAVIKNVTNDPIGYTGTYRFGPVS